MICEECKPKKIKANYIWFDNTKPRRLVPICDECHHQLIHMFGEDEVTSFDLEYFRIESLIERVNRSFKWGEDMMQMFRNKIKELEKKNNENKEME